MGEVLHRIEGAYALGIICADEPDRLIAVRKDSPLILGLGRRLPVSGQSDVTAIIKHTREVMLHGGRGACGAHPGGHPVL